MLSGEIALKNNHYYYYYLAEIMIENAFPQTMAKERRYNETMSAQR